MQGKKNVFTNPCGERWNEMTGDERKRMCSICQENVEDISELDLKTVSETFINSAKCVKMSPDQIHFFKFLRSIPKVAGLSAALSLFPFSETLSQEETSIEDTCIVYGKVHSNITANRSIYVIVDGQTFETRSDEYGSFKLILPRGQKIDSSNVRQLDNRTLTNEILTLKKARLPKTNAFRMGKTIGTPSF